MLAGFSVKEKTWYVLGAVAIQIKYISSIHFNILIRQNTFYFLFLSNIQFSSYDFYLSSSKGIVGHFGKYTSSS